MSDHTELVEQTTAELDLLAQDMDLTDDERLTCSRASDTIQRQAEEIEALRADAERWQALYRRAINEANGLTNYVEERPELTCAERRIAKIEADARAAMQGGEGMSPRTCDYGCNGCDECTDYEDEPREPPEFGCCLQPGECCMPGLHFPSECHTAAAMQGVKG